MLTSQRDQWTATFGIALVSHIGARFRLESRETWRYGRFVVHINPENGDGSLVSIFAMEKPAKGRFNDASKIAKEFEYFLDNDPFVAAQMVIRWVSNQ